MLCQITKLSLCTSNTDSVEVSGSIPLGPPLIMASAIVVTNRRKTIR